jgi:hypothetical protein
MQDLMMVKADLACVLVSLRIWLSNGDDSLPIGRDSHLGVDYKRWERVDSRNGRNRKKLTLLDRESELNFLHNPLLLRGMTPWISNRGDSYFVPKILEKVNVDMGNRGSEPREIGNGGLIPESKHNGFETQ